jgi:hypothetical protein
LSTRTRKVKATSAAVTGLPSWNRAPSRRRKVRDERSAANWKLSASRPYSVKGSSRDCSVRVSKRRPRPSAELPLTMKGLKLSKVPVAARRTVPPLGASGLV